MKKLTKSTIAAGMLSFSLPFTLMAEKPSIIVGITVDQLRTDYLEQLRPYFGDKGFNFLMTEGVYIPDVDFKQAAGDAPTGAAIIYTGAWPNANGVSSAYSPDLTLKRNVAALSADPAKPRQDYSPENLRLSTLADELFINQGGLTKIYSLAADPQVAVISTGHAGSSAIYLDEYSGRWTAPAYYGTPPSIISNKNRTSPLSTKITATNWRPMHPAAFYNAAGTWKGADFRYGFSGGNRDAYTRYALSPAFNSDLTDSAIELLNSLKPASGDTGPVMINIAYSAAPIPYDYDDDNRPELYDTYVRLDADLEKLIKAIETAYGREKALIFLSSTGYAQEPSLPESDAKLPSGEITLKKAESLLNSYLSALHGNGDYVALFKDGKIFLENKILESKGLKADAIRNEIKGFLLKMGGVSEVFTLDEVLNSNNRRVENLALRVDMKNAPDLFVNFTPGWSVIDDNSYPPLTKKARLSAPPMPAFILAPDLAPQTIGVPVEATAIVPTVTSLMNIRAPNGAASKPLTLQKKNNSK